MHCSVKEFWLRNAHTLTRTLVASRAKFEEHPLSLPPYFPSITAFSFFHLVETRTLLCTTPSRFTHTYTQTLIQKADHFADVTVRR